jgi:hypothetical protein
VYRTHLSLSTTRTPARFNSVQRFTFVWSESPDRITVSHSPGGSGGSATFATIASGAL